MFKLDDDYEILQHDDGHGQLVENQYLVIGNDEDQPTILIDATPLDDPAPKALAERLVELLNTAPTSLWRCRECGREVRLTFAEMADIGNPICGQPGCKNEDGEMELVEGEPKVMSTRGYHMDPPPSILVPDTNEQMFRVAFVIDVSAVSPQAAAAQVEDILRDTERLPGCYEVVNVSGEHVEIDLSALTCHECGKPFVRAGDGTTRHVDSDGHTDRDADENHVPFETPEFP